MAHANKSLDVANDKIRQLEIDLKRKSEELDGVKNIRTSKTKALQIENDKLGYFFWNLQDYWSYLKNFDGIRKLKIYSTPYDKLRMDLSNQTNHGHTLEVTIQNLEVQLSQVQQQQSSQQSNQQQSASQIQQLLSELNQLKVQLSEAAQEKGSLEEQNFQEQEYAKLLAGLFNGNLTDALFWLFTLIFTKYQSKRTHSG